MTDSEYDRGVAAGQIAERLASHDRHFESINGSLVSMNIEMHSVTLAIQRLSDDARASAETVVATAAALKAADDARRAASSEAWSPFQRLIAVIAAAAVLMSTYLAIVHH